MRTFQRTKPMWREAPSLFAIVVLISISRFGDQLLRDIDITDVQNFRTWLLKDEKDGGAGYSQGYAGLVFGCFRKSLDHAVQMQYLSSNVSKRVK